jgi:hypothetical protein
LSRYMILSALLVFLITGLSLAQEADNSSIMDNATVFEDINETITAPEETPAVESEVAPENVTVEEPAVIETAPEVTPNLKYIWMVSGIEAEQITMALNQEDSDLFGQAKYETDDGEPWNGVVIGSVMGDQVDIIITALKGDTLVSTMMSGTFADEALSGSYFQTSEGQITGRGDFTAMWINDDITAYTPAAIEQPAAEVVPAETVTATATEETQQPVQLGSSSRFSDVRQYADQVLTGVGDLSQIPIGMGGSMG